MLNTQMSPDYGQRLWLEILENTPPRNDVERVQHAVLLRMVHSADQVSLSRTFEPDKEATQLDAYMARLTKAADNPLLSMLAFLNGFDALPSVVYSYLASEDEARSHLIWKEDAESFHALTFTHDCTTKKVGVCGWLVTGSIKENPTGRWLIRPFSLFAREGDIDVPPEEAVAQALVNELRTVVSVLSVESEGCVLTTSQLIIHPDFLFNAA